MPRLDPAWFEGLCELGPRPLVTTGWFRLWLTGHFVQAENLEDQDDTGPVLRMLWRPDKTTGIAIEPSTKWTPELTESRPAIIIKRGAWHRTRLGIDDRMMGTNPGDGQERYENSWQGSHTLFCIANDDSEVELLAAEVFRELNQFGPAIRYILGLKRFAVAEVGEIMVIEEAPQNFVVPINVSYAYSETWKIVTEAPALKRLDLSLLRP